MFRYVSKVFKMVPKPFLGFYYIYIRFPRVFHGFSMVLYAVCFAKALFGEGNVLYLCGAFSKRLTP